MKQPHAGPLHRSVLWSGAGSAVYAASQYGMLMALARLGSTTHVGQFALATALATPVIVLSQMQLRQLQVTDVAGHYTPGQYLGTRGVASVAAVGLILLVALASGYRGEMLLVIALVAVAKGLESMSDIAHGVLQRAERMDLIARALVLKGLISLVVFAALLALTGQLVASVAGMALVWGLLLLFYDLPLGRSAAGPGALEPSVDAGVLRTLARTALPLSFASGLLALSANIPRYALEVTRDSAAVGLFAVASVPLAILAIANTAVHQATLPRAAMHYHRGEWSHVGRISTRVAVVQTAAAALLALILGLAGGPLMRILFGPEYEAMGALAALMAAGVAVNGLGVWGATLLFAARRFNLQLIFVGALLVTQVPLAVLLIDRFGLYGAAWSEFIKSAVAAVLLTGIWLHVLRTRPVPDTGARVGPVLAESAAGPQGGA